MIDEEAYEDGYQAARLALCSLAEDVCAARDAGALYTGPLLGQASPNELVERYLSRAERAVAIAKEPA